MKYFIKRIICLIVTAVVLITPLNIMAQDIERFNDVPKGHWADNDIHEFKALNITEGIGNNKFGFGQSIKRDEFAAFIVKLKGWEVANPNKGSFLDNQDTKTWYYKTIETCLKNGVFSIADTYVRPEELITREEMAVMLVKSLGYDALAGQLASLDTPFNDVTKSLGYITIAKDTGIISGKGNNLFAPKASATREEAVAMLMRMYKKLNSKISELHAFYAIKSYNQRNMINDLSSVSFGWSRVEYDVSKKQLILNTDRQNGNEYGIPSGFTEPLDIAKQKNISTQLMVTLKDQNIIDETGKSNISLSQYILLNPDNRSQIINEIVSQIKATSKDNKTVTFDGVVIDFESLTGEVLKSSFNLFLSELKSKLILDNKNLYVTVHPKRKAGLSYFDAYDFKTIGFLSDKVILMAHDYNAKKLTEMDMKNNYSDTPLTPFDEVYFALKTITDKDNGVSDKSKIMLQISFGSAQWKSKDGKIINSVPYEPGYDAINALILNNSSKMYSDFSQNPYLKFFDNKDQTNNIIWYEDSRSVNAKIKLAKMFGINGISIWRLGNIPAFEDTLPDKSYMDVWQQIMKQT